MVDQGLKINYLSVLAGIIFLPVPSSVPTCDAHPGIPTSSFVQDLFCIAALPHFGNLPWNFFPSISVGMKVGVWDGAVNKQGFMRGLKKRKSAIYGFSFIHENVMRCVPVLQCYV